MKKAFLILIFITVSCYGISQVWVPLYAGSSMMVDADGLKNHKDYLQFQNGYEIKTSDWNGYLKNFVLKFPAATGDSILDGLTRGYSEYDKVEKMIRFGPDRDEASEYFDNSYIAFSGFIKNSKISAFVKFNYSGSNWIYANRIKLVCDDDTFEFDSLSFFSYEASTFVSEYVILDFDENMYRLITKIISSNETIIRFYGDPMYSDLVVSEKMKLDMKSFLKTINALQ